MTLPEQLEAADAGEQRGMLIEAFEACYPRPNQVRVVFDKNGKPWTGDGLGPYTEEYKSWLQRHKQFFALIDVGAFLDAAMTLVPENHRYRTYTLEDGRGAAWVWHALEPMPDGKFERLHANTTLALASAAIKARGDG